MSDGAEGPLAEYTALRNEVERRSQQQQHLLTLQLTSAGAVFSYALAASGRLTLLLIVPLSSYLLCGRFSAQWYAVRRIALFVDTELSPHIPGGLRWQVWSANFPRTDRWVSQMFPLLLTFPGVSALALIWGGVGVVGGAPVGFASWLGYGVGWVIGLAATVMSGYLIIGLVLRRDLKPRRSAPKAR